jgi:hypothetical protein
MIGVLDQILHVSEAPFAVSRINGDRFQSSELAMEVNSFENLRVDLILNLGTDGSSQQQKAADDKHNFPQGVHPALLSLTIGSSIDTDLQRSKQLSLLPYPYSIALRYPVPPLFTTAGCKALASGMLALPQDELFGIWKLFGDGRGA